MLICNVCRWFRRRSKRDQLLVTSQRHVDQLLRQPPVTVSRPTGHGVTHRSPADVDRVGVDSGLLAAGEVL